MVRPLAVFILAILILSAACGGPEAQPDRANDPSLQDTELAITDEDEGESPGTDLGDRMGETYIASLKSLLRLLRDNPPAEEILPRIQTLWDESTAKMVELGRQREELTGPAERLKADLAFEQARLTVADRFVPDLQIHIEHYRTANPSLAELLRTFYDSLPLYGDLEKLRSQKPAEAQRLGID